MRRGDETLRIINVGPDRINRLNDRFAKYLLAGPNSKPILIDFINDVLMLEGDGRIQEVALVSAELVPNESGLKLSLLDVAAVLADKRTVDIEIQVVNQHDFERRAPFYWAARHSRKLVAGMTFVEIKPTITICLLAFDLLEDEEEYRNSYSIRNDRSGRRLCDDMQIIYLISPE